MKKNLLLLCVSLFLLFSANPAFSMNLYDWGLNVDGDLYLTPDYDSPPDPDQLAPYIDDSAFDWEEGLGMISVLYIPPTAGDCYLGMYVDHEIGQNFYNEYGEAHGTLGAGQSWEIDEPGFVDGDISNNFSNAALDNSNAVTSDSVDNVSMALGWNSTLAVDEHVRVKFYISETMPDNVFFLSHTDQESNETAYFYSDIEVSGTPEPTTIVLLGFGLMALANIARRSPRNRA